MQINQIVCLIDDLGGEQVSDALADTALGIARVHAIQIFTVYRAVVDSTAQKRGHVGNVHHDDRAGECRRIYLRSHCL